MSIGMCLLITKIKSWETRLIEEIRANTASVTGYPDREILISKEIKVNQDRGWKIPLFIFLSPHNHIERRENCVEAHCNLCFINYLLVVLPHASGLPFNSTSRVSQS